MRDLLSSLRSKMTYGTKHETFKKEKKRKIHLCILLEKCTYKKHETFLGSTCGV